MRKKQANPYKLPATLQNPPYLTPNELSQFQSQFIVYDLQLDLRKLRESFLNIMTTANGDNSRPVEQFVTGILAKKDKCGFNEYITLMGQFFSKQNQGELVMEMLSQDKKQLSQQLIRQVLEQTMGRDVSDKQLAQIMVKLFQVDDGRPIGKASIVQLLANSKNRI